MTTRKPNFDYAIPADENAPEYDVTKHVPIAPNITSIQARTVLTISVSMSISEIETLMGSFGKRAADLSEIERAVQSEFVIAVESTR